MRKIYFNDNNDSVHEKALFAWDNALKIKINVKFIPHERLTILKKNYKSSYSIYIVDLTMR